MARTIRNVDPRTTRYAIAEDASPSWKRRQMLHRTGKKIFRSDKCQDATVDGEGNSKLNTWSECPSKADNHANRQIRRTAGVQIRRQLETM